MKYKIPVSQPLINQPAALRYLTQAIRTGWVSSQGPFVAKFETEFARFIGTKYAVSATSGTAALHLALATLNIGPGDEVIVPTFTMIATILPVIYQSATPVLVDSETTTGNLDINQISAKITSRTRAIIPVHLHGHPADMEPLLTIARRHKLAIIEDAAEAHGAQYRTSSRTWKSVGSLGHMGCFSFYANKIITTGEGGMVTTNSLKLRNRLHSLRNLARTPSTHFLHQEIGFAYRLSNLQAALGLAQLQQANKFIAKKRHIAALYTKLLSPVKTLTLPVELPYTKSVFWHYTILLKNQSQRNQLTQVLDHHGIETRTFFIPLHRQPALKGKIAPGSFPVAQNLSSRGLCLPSGLAITDAQIRTVCQLIRQFLS